MFEQDSRYFHLADLVYEDENGEQVIYKARRIIPQPETVPSVVSTDVAQGQRLDQIAYTLLGKATLSWKVGDANLAFSLQELEQAGTTIRIPSNGKVPG